MKPSFTFGFGLFPLRRNCDLLPNMDASRIEVTREEEHNNWLIRIWVGDEVIRRHCHEPANAARETLLKAALKTAEDEGYTVDPSKVIVP